jgi:hypothetical protein
VSRGARHKSPTSERGDIECWVGAYKVWGALYGMNYILSWGWGR